MKKTLLSTMTVAVLAGLSVSPSHAASTLFESKDILTPAQALGRFQWLEVCYPGLLLEVHDQMFDATAPLSNEEKLAALEAKLLYKNGSLRSDAKYLTFANSDNENPSNWFAGTAPVSAASCPTIPSDYGISAMLVTPTTPSYCEAVSRDKDYEFIKQVSFADMTNASEATLYSNFIGHAAKVHKDTAYTVTLTPGFVDGDSYPETWHVFIDWNQDGDFLDQNEGHYAGVSESPVTLNLTPPNGAVTGLTKMRVTMDYFGGNSNACADVSSGEIEDYLVYIK